VRSFQNNEAVRVSYSTPQDLVPSESDYAASQDTATASAPARHKYTTDSVSRSFQLDEDPAASTFVAASPRGLPLPHLYVGEAEDSGNLEPTQGDAESSRLEMGMRPLVYRAYGDTLLPVSSK